MVNWKRDTQKDLDYEGTHDLRWNTTLAKISRLAVNFSNATKVLALGTDGQFESQLKDKFPNLHIDISDWDLRFPFPVPPEDFDFCLALEVIEHLKDRDDHSQDIATHYFTGLMSFLLQAHKALKPGGLLILTTPNSSSWDTVFRTLGGKSNFMYWPHVRELAPLEISYFLNQTGFQVNEIESFSPYATDFVASRLHLVVLDFFRFILRGDPKLKKLRGSTLYIVAQKIDAPKEVLLETEWHQVRTSDLER